MFAHALEVDVGTDQEVAEQEHLPLLGLEQLPAVAVHGLGQRLTQQQLPWARAQHLHNDHTWWLQGADGTQDRPIPAPRWNWKLPVLAKNKPSPEFPVNVLSQNLLLNLQKNLLQNCPNTFSRTAQNLLQNFPKTFSKAAQNLL